MVHNIAKFNVPLTMNMRIIWPRATNKHVVIPKGGHRIQLENMVK